MTRRCCPSTIRFANGPPPHAYGTGRIQIVRRDALSGRVTRFGVGEQRIERFVAFGAA